MSAQKIINWLHVVSDRYEQFTDLCVDEKRPDSTPTLRAEELLKMKSNSGQADRRFLFFFSMFLLWVNTALENISVLSASGQQSGHHSPRVEDITKYLGFLSNQTSYLEMFADWRTRLSHTHCFPEVVSPGHALIEDLGCSTPTTQSYLLPHLVSVWIKSENLQEQF